MIQSLILENFQAHKHSVLEFDKGVNVIVGQSDNGKSSIIRALRWVITNKPSGDEFRSWAGGDTKAILTTDDGHTIKRIKTNSLNSYELGKLEFKAFKTDVPVEIVKALKINEANFQQQHDKHFLISETPGAVALHFNKVANLDKIDKGTSAVQAQINSISADIKYYKTEIEGKEKQISSFIDIDAAENEVAAIELLEAKTYVASTIITKINRIIDKLETNENEYWKIFKKVKPENEINTILALYERQRNKRTEKKELSAIVSKLDSINEDLEKAKKIIKASTEINTVLELYEKRKNGSATQTKLGQLYTKLITIEKRITYAENKSVELQKEFDENMPEVCPLCNSKIKQNGKK